jgi:APA family basic amino acid/polyamine antiporter
VLVTITVPQNTPIDAPMPEAESKAHAIIDQAKVLGGRRVTGHPEKVRQGEAGRRIVMEAEEIRARAIVMTMPRGRKPPGSTFGRTLDYVLAKRPARVIVDSPRPTEKPTPAAA